VKSVVKGEEMDVSTAQAVAQAKSLRALCAEFAFGASRDAFLDRVDREVGALFSERLRITLVCLGNQPAERWRHLAALTPPTPQPTLVMITEPATPDRTLPLAAAAANAGIQAVNVVCDPAAAFASPVLFGNLLQETDLLIVCGPLGDGDPIAAGIARLAEVCGHALHWQAGGSAETIVAALRNHFRDWQTVADPQPDSPLDLLATTIDADRRRQLLVTAVLARLAMIADLLMRSVQNEAAAVKFRQSELIRLRRGEDAGANEPREQAELIKSILDEWANARKEEVTLANEDGVLPFDPRLLANKLSITDLIRRSEQTAAEAKYGILRSGLFQGMITHHYALVPDPAAINGIQSRLVNALDIQVRKDIDLLNQQAGDLADRLRRGGEIYPSFAEALKSAQLPVLDRAAFDRVFSGIAIEAEVEEAFVQEGVFKRLMAGRMFASMAFSFVTMGAGLFVLFGEPSIKRGLMKFSGVIVIIMIIYFIFSFLIKAEEEKKQLEEKLDRIREQINQAVVRPLAKVEQTIVKNYQAFVDDVKNGFLAAIEAVSKAQATERARFAERRKAEDEVIKGHSQRRLQAGAAVAQKVQQFLTNLDRLRQDGKPATGARAALAGAPKPATAVSARPAPATALAAAAAAIDSPATPETASSPGPGPTDGSDSAAASAPKMGALERLAALKAKREAAAAVAASTRPAAGDDKPNT
jgi:hypothetical protein